MSQMMKGGVKDAYALSERYRQRGVPTVIGGLHVTACPEEALAHCDAVVVGDNTATPLRAAVLEKLAVALRSVGRAEEARAAEREREALLAE